MRLLMVAPIEDKERVHHLCSLIEAINYQNQRQQVYEPLPHKPGMPEMHALKDDLLQWTDEVIRGRLKRLQEKVPALLDDI
jgi:hypothetical protein